MVWIRNLGTEISFLGPYVKISITDTVVGMDEETQKRMELDQLFTLWRAF